MHVFHYRHPEAPIPFRTDVVLFDMDGVLVDVSGSYLRVVEETVAHFTGRPLPAGTVERYKARGGFNDDWRLTAALLDEAEVEVPFEEVVAAFQERYRGANWDGRIAQEPALIATDTLAYLSGRVPLALVTGRPEAEARWTLDRFGWSPFFPVVVGMEEQAGRGKPDPFPLLAALDHLGDAAAAPARTVYVGDRVDDMQAARAAGCGAVGVVPPHLDAAEHADRLAEAGAHFVLCNVDFLPQALELP